MREPVLVVKVQCIDNQTIHVATRRITDTWVKL